MTHSAASAPQRANALTVRYAEPAEFAAVADLTQRSFSAGPYGHLPSSPERRFLERDAEGRARDGALLVAVSNDSDNGTGRIVGSATVLRAGTPYSRVARTGEAELRLLVVDPAVQGAGIGDALVRASIGEARSWGVSAVVLDTGSLNERAQRLYLRTGFQRLQHRTIPNHPGQVEPFLYSYSLDDAAGTRIRLIRAAEYDAVADLAEAANLHDYTLDEGYRLSLRAVAERAREHEVWVAEDLATGALLGTVATPRPGRHISDLGQAGELDFRLLAVHPDVRGRGVGELLTRHVLNLATQRGVRRVVMNSGPDMVAAHRLYYRLGFTLVPERAVTIDDVPVPFVLHTFALEL